MNKKVFAALISYQKLLRAKDSQVESYERFFACTFCDLTDVNLHKLSNENRNP